MLTPEAYTIIVSWFPRLIGLIYLFAFFPFLFQIKGLIGESGILPLSNYLDYYRRVIPIKKRLWYLPSVFWWRSDDRALMAVIWAGVILSLLLIAGVFPPLLLLLLYVLYISVVSAGQDFLSFGWEGLLLETTVHAFLLSWTVIPNPVVWISVNFLLFRFFFQAGLIKLKTHDRTWRDLTAVAYHYQSQPLPNTIAWYVHKLPLWFQKGSTFLMFVLELVAPFGIFFTEEIRLFTFFALFLLQWAIWVTGNFSFLNHLSVVMIVILIGNRYLEPILGAAPQAQEASLWLQVPLYVLGTGLLFIQVITFLNQIQFNATFSQILREVSPFHLGNRFAIFGSMTTKRYEIVVEGSEDGILWKEYLFWYKPSEITRRPRRIAPYQPRLDWQAWFLPFSSYQDNPWFHYFLIRLLQGKPAVLALLRYNPFPDKPPHYVRAKIYDYVFSDFKTKHETGQWWSRQLIGAYSPILSEKK